MGEGGKRYLRSQSKLYKERVSDIQKLILPSLKRNCPTCINCCKLYTPELSIYIANNFVGKDKVVNNDNIPTISKMLDIISIHSEHKSINISKNITLVGVSKKETLPELTYEKIRDIKDTEIYNKDLNDIYQSSYLFPNIKLKTYDIDRFKSSLDYYLSTLNDTYINNTINYDN